MKDRQEINRRIFNNADKLLSILASEAGNLSVKGFCDIVDIHEDLLDIAMKD